MGRTKKYTQISNIENTSNTENISNIENTSNIEYFEINNIIDISSFKKKEKMLYDVLNDFFAKCEENEIKTIIDIINGKYKISLRFLDWFVTRYCYLYKTSIQINNTYYKENDFNINISYKAQLKSFKKKCFDPFKRKNKFYYSFNRNIVNYTILSTLGQLNFFKWALSFGIIKHVEDNFDKINNKINYVNSFFKKNLIENNTYSLISSDELKSKLSNSLNESDNQNESDKSNESNESDNMSIKNKIILSNKKKENNLSYKSSKKNLQTYNPIISRNIFLEL